MSETEDKNLEDITFEDIKKFIDDHRENLNKKPSKKNQLKNNLKKKVEF